MNRVKRIERFHPNWKAVVISIVALLVVFLSSGQVGADESKVDPAAAFPGDTLFYLEIARPVETMDILVRMACWPQALAVIEESAKLLHNGKGADEMFRLCLSEWGEHSEFRKHMAAIAGEMIAVGLTPAPVIALRGSADGDPVASLAWLANRFTEGTVVQSDRDSPRAGFWVYDKCGDTLFAGRQAGEWLVMSLPSGVEVVDKTASALLSRGLKCSASLSGMEDFQRAMSGLPESPSARAFVNTPKISEHIQACSMLSDMAKRLMEACIDWTGSVGMARKVEVDCIRTWVTGQMRRHEIEASVPGFFESMTPINEPLSLRLPAAAMATYEVGAHPEKLFEMAGYLLKAAAPLFHQEITGWSKEFISISGLNPKADFFPFLDTNMAVAWLPSSDDGGRWPLPRSVVLMRVKDRERILRFLKEFIHWNAGATAPHTGGWIGARVANESYEGVELMGLKLDSLFSLPLPSPTFAVVDDLLIASPVPSAVKEAVSAVHGNAPTLSEEILFGKDPLHSRTMELIYWNPKAWEKDWEKCWELGFSACRFLFLDREFVAGISKEMSRMDQVGKALHSLLATFDPATGTTLLHEDGRFIFSMEFRF